MTTDKLLDRIETIAVFENKISNLLLSLQYRVTVLEAQLSPGVTVIETHIGRTHPPDPTRVRGRVDEARTRPPDPTPEMLASLEFNVVWDIIKNWDVDHAGGMRSGATGNDAAYIVNALRALRSEDAL